MKKAFLSAGCALLLMLAACNNEPQQPAAPFSTADVAESPSSGSAIFQKQCGACHSLDKRGAGPALAGSLQRWGNDRQKLKSFIRDSKSVIESGDAYAKSLYETWFKTNMPSFTYLTDAQLDSLVTYIQ